MRYPKLTKKVLAVAFSRVENLCALCGSIFSLFVYPSTQFSNKINDSSPRDPKQGERGKIDKFNKIRLIFEFFRQNGVGGI